MTAALILALTLMAGAPNATASAPPPDDSQGEPLPPGAPHDPYELSAWCYGALGEYLAIYEKVKPDLRDIDHMFGSSVVEDEPYQADMAAYRVELKVIADSVTDAEKASPTAITQRGVAEMQRGREIWSLAEAKTTRELARAWLSWDLPDKCDTNARELDTRSIILGKALKYNANDTTALPAAHPDLATPAEGHGTPGKSSDQAPETAAQAFSTPLINPPAPSEASGSTDGTPPATENQAPPTETTAGNATATSPTTTGERPASEIATGSPPSSQGAAPEVSQETASDEPSATQPMDTNASAGATSTGATSSASQTAATNPPSSPPVTATASPSQTSSPNSDQSQEPTL